MINSLNSHKLLYSLIAILISIIFILDILTPLGYAIGVAYLFPMLLTSFHTSSKSIIFTTILCIAFTMLGFIFSPKGSDLLQVLWNRLLAILVISIIAIFIIRQFKNNEQSNELQLELNKMQRLDSLGILAGGIAHDFNNILTMLFGNISLAKDHFPKDNKGYKYLNNAEEAYQRALRLSTQLLTFSKGGLPIKSSFKIDEFINETAQFDLSGSNIKLNYKSHKNIWNINADKGQIEQVFTNLFINAKQAMPSGGNIYITVENIVVPSGRTSGPPSGKNIKVSIKDEGVGISPDKLNHIFDPYFSTKETGNGLGLATVHSIIQKHKGHISVESTLGKGTQFIIHLPATISSAPTIPIQEDSSEKIIKQKSKILVMDDEDLICQLVSTILQSCEYSVDVAKDGEEAVEMYRKAFESGQTYDCIIMDLTIPGGMGGKEAMAIILKLNPNAKAVVTSGYTIDSILADHEEYGFKAFLSKPFTPSSLKEIINAVLNNDAISPVHLPL